MFRELSTRKKKPGRSRISAEERKAAIIVAAMELFARKGFSGTTTKDLARAAGVSEALIFSHFPSKEDLYKNVQYLCLEAQSAAEEGLASLMPGTRALVLAVQTLVFEVFESFAGRGRSELLRRLQIHSMLEDGRFAAAFFRAHFRPWFPFVLRCMSVSRKSGDIVAAEIPDENTIWFVHHLPMMVRLSMLAPEAIEFKKSARLLDQMCLFCLRGMGMTDQAVRKFYPVDENLRRAREPL